MGFLEKVTEAITSWNKKHSGNPEDKSIVWRFNGEKQK
jgi:hypothetical protein